MADREARVSTGRPFDGALDAWAICTRTTAFLVEGMPDALWALPLPGSPRSSVRSLCAHLHNCRCMWMKAMGTAHGVRVPAGVKRAAVTRSELLLGLAASARAIDGLLRAGVANNGVFPGSRGGFVWGAIPRDVVRFTTYAVAHESHHRGQIVLVARQLGHRLPAGVVAGLWQWAARLRESR